jgi:hypothetical protein
VRAVAVEIDRVAVAVDEVAPGDEGLGEQVG